MRYRLLKGGNGGFGNHHFKSATNQAPDFAMPGQPAEEKIFILKLKLIADAGLIGMPNAGKSTFLSRVSAARPKIADYPFTTLEPQLGVVKIDETDFVLADLPGLIEGAHEGVGLGDRFLGHAERCASILHLIDGTGDAVAKTYKTIRDELEAYGHGLDDKPEIVALNKVDAIPEKELAKKNAALEKACGHKMHVISGVTGEGINTVLRAMAREITHRRTDARGRSPVCPPRTRPPHPHRTADGQFQRAGGAPAPDKDPDIAARGCESGRACKGPDLDGEGQGESHPEMRQCQAQDQACQSQGKGPDRQGQGQAQAAEQNREAGEKEAAAMSGIFSGAKLVVVKVGSALLVDGAKGELRREWLASLCDDVAALKKDGVAVVLVSSGSIALGRRLLKLPAGELRLEESQAAAAAGQVRLAEAYADMFASRGIVAAQVLLTFGDTEERRRYLNARATLGTLVGLGAVPVINENDTVATAEIKFGDNDRLGAARRLHDGRRPAGAAVRRGRALHRQSRHRCRRQAYSRSHRHHRRDRSHGGGFHLRLRARRHDLQADRRQDRHGRGLRCDPGQGRGSQSAVGVAIQVRAIPSSAPRSPRPPPEALDRGRAAPRRRAGDR